MNSILTYPDTVRIALFDGLPWEGREPRDSPRRVLPVDPCTSTADSDSRRERRSLSSSLARESMIP